MAQSQAQNRKKRQPAAKVPNGDSKSVPAAGPLALHVIGGPDRFNGLVQILEAQGLQSADSLEDIENTLRKDEDTHAVLIYANPVTLFGEKLQVGEAISDVITTWRDATEHLLSLFRRDRRRITLLDGHAALRAPNRLGQLLSDRLPCSLNVEKGAEAAKSDTEAGGLPQLVAAQALRQDEMAATLVAELEASSLPLGPANHIDLEAIIAEGLDGSVSAELDELKEENELLVLQLHQAQEELEAHFLENRKLDGEKEKIQADADKARAKAKEAEKAWAADRKSLADELRRNANTLAAVRRSLSWRLTAPVRRVLGLFLGDSKI